MNVHHYYVVFLQNEIARQLSNLSLSSTHPPPPHRSTYSADHSPARYPRNGGQYLLNGGVGAGNDYQPTTYTPDLQRRLAYGTENRQRRWSDSGNQAGQANKPDDYQHQFYQQSPNGIRCQCGTDHRDAPPNSTDFGSGSQKLSRPKVSFGPMMMYDPNEPSDGPLFDSSWKSSANSKKNTRLTTELLPLDTQIPLQMMSDSAVVCNII